VTTLFLPSDLKRDEGWKHEAYKDTLGNWTIGCGHQDSHVHAGMIWDDATIRSQLMHDIHSAERALDGSKVFNWWRQLDDVRQDALVNMCFNMGASTLATFSDFLQLLRAGHYAQAADDVIHTLWAKQVGNRAKRIARQIATGEHQNA
jgi:lysozyme